MKPLTVVIVFNVVLVPDRRRFKHVNVVCVHSHAVLAGRRGMGEGAVLKGAVWGAGSGMRLLTLSRGPARMGICTQVQRAAIIKGFFSY
jgi:hypothetical protein